MPSPVITSAFDQAIFSSAKLSENEGYQVIAHTPGVRDALQEIARWSPSHESLQQMPEIRRSFNGFGLSDGRWCLSLSKYGEREFSGRGRNIETTLLIGDEAATASFGHQAMRVLHAALSTPREGLDNRTDTLQPFSIVGGGGSVSLTAVAEVCKLYGAAAIACAVDYVLRGSRVAIALQGSRRSLLDALFSLLPIDFRRTVSFTSGLTCSKQRPFQVHLCAPESEEPRQFKRLFAGTLIDLRSPPQHALQTPWSIGLLPLLEAGRWCDVRRFVQAGELAAA